MEATNNATHIINSYFPNIIFQKSDLNTTRGISYVIYAAKILTQMGDGGYYILLHVRNTESLDASMFPSRAKIDALNWTSLQTRTLKESPYTGLTAQRWNIPRSSNGLVKLPDPEFRYVERKGQYTKYLPSIRSKNNFSFNHNPSFPFELILLHDPKKKSIYQYHNTVTLMVALNTFQCVISKTYSTATNTGNNIGTQLDNEFDDSYTVID